MGKPILNDHLGKGDSAHSQANSAHDGFMSAADKIKVDSLSDYTHPSTHDANMIALDTTNFDNNLDNTIDDVQKLAEAVDELVSGSTGSVTNSAALIYTYKNIGGSL